MSYEEEDEFDSGFKMYDDEEDEFANPVEDDEYDLEDENPERDG